MNASNATTRSSSATTTTATIDDGSGRIALIGIALVLATILGAVTLGAQQFPTVRGAIRPYVGAWIPTGDQREVFEDAVLVGAQASLNATPNVAITGSFGWAPGSDKLTAGSQKIDTYQYDLGLEARSLRESFAPFKPFIGAGVGGRTYRYRDLDVDARNNLAGYGALGFDLSIGAVEFRLEGRDYVSGFKPLTGAGESKTRNDVAIFAGLGLQF